MDDARPSPDVAGASDARPLSLAIVQGSVSHRAGGLFNSVRSCALALDRLGHRVRVFSLADADTESDIAAWRPLVPEVLPTLGPHQLRYAPALAARLAQGGFDVVHQQGIWQAFSTSVLGWGRRQGGAVMISPRGMLEPWAVRNSGLKKRIAGGLYEHSNLAGARCLHALNASEAQAMREYGLTNPVAVIANGTDLVDAPVPPPPAWWPARRKVMLFLGRIHPKKGLAELVEAWARLSANEREHARDWHLVLAGWDDGGHLGRLREAVERAGLGDRVTLPGPLHGADKHAALAHADAFVLPSHSEGLPMSVLEAWAHGLPVLMTEACNLPEGFREGAAVRIVTEPEGLAEGLAAALGAPGLAGMGEAGRRLVEARFGWEEIACRHAEVYAWMIAGADRAGAPACVLFP